MHLFYKAIVESILVLDCVVWFTACRLKADLSLLKRIVRQAEKILGVQLHFEDLCKSRIVDKAKSIIGNELHPLNDNYVVLRSGNRLRSVRCRTSRFLDSFMPIAQLHVEYWTKEWQLSDKIVYGHPFSLWANLLWKSF